MPSLDFKSNGRRSTSAVGSIPTYPRQSQVPQGFRGSEAILFYLQNTQKAPVLFRPSPRAVTKRVRSRKTGWTLLWVYP